MKNKRTSSFSHWELLDQKKPLFLRFHQKTEMKKNTTIPDPKDWPKEWKTVYYKSYTRLPEMHLPSPHNLQSTALIATLEERSSERTFSPQPLSLKQISTLLYYSAGIKHQRSKNATSRFYPSGGARYPLELYIISLNTELPKGIYHYYLKNNSLEQLLVTPELRIHDYFNDSWVKKAGCIVLLTAVSLRNTMKYGDRGYRYMLTEAGHLGQNIYLLSTALNLACCATESFVDKNIHALLDLDETKEVVLYALCTGNKA